MKNLFDKLEQSIKNTCKEAANQSQKTVNQTKYRTELMSLKNELKKQYQKLGETYYKELINEELTLDYTAQCDKITGLIKTIAKLEREVETVVNEQKEGFEDYKQNVRETWTDAEQAKNKETIYQEIKTYKVCEKCQQENRLEAICCSRCGEKFEDKDEIVLGKG